MPPSNVAGTGPRRRRGRRRRWRYGRRTSHEGVVSRAERDARSATRIRPLGDFLHDEAVAAVLLVVAAAIAFVWANSAWSDSYHDLWGTDVTLAIGDHAITLDVQDW